MYLPILTQGNKCLWVLFESTIIMRINIIVEILPRVNIMTYAWHMQKINLFAKILCTDLKVPDIFPPIKISWCELPSGVCKFLKWNQTTNSSFYSKQRAKLTSNTKLFLNLMTKLLMQASPINHFVIAKIFWSFNCMVVKIFWFFVFFNHAIILVHVSFLKGHRTTSLQLHPHFFSSFFFFSKILRSLYHKKCIPL